MRTRRQSGFALLMVMIVAVAGVILGLSYLSVASLKMEVSHSFQAMARARYLAESGIEHALFVLRFTPEQLQGSAANPLGPYYAGEGDEPYYISAQAVDGEPGAYIVTASATAGGLTRSTSAKVFRADGEHLDIEHGVFVNAGLAWLPWGLDVSGDVHVNGFLLNDAAVEGDATATEGLWDPWGRITGLTDGQADPVALPGVSPSQYDQYGVGATVYDSVVFTGSDLTSDDPLADGGAITPENPAGVVRLAPECGDTVTLHDNLAFTGTLVIEGHLKLDGEDITLTATDGFPAVVVTGKVLVTDSASNVTINGLVVAGEGFCPGTLVTAGSSTRLTGALVSEVRGYSALLLGAHEVRFNGDRARIYNMGVPPEMRRPVVEVVRWED